MAESTGRTYDATSPRNFSEGGHDITNAGINMKEQEDQVKGLTKENFSLKLRIYFLEQKLSNTGPPGAQGLLEQNVRLQVEVEELKRQLSDTQELLAAAAEAIGVLEQQGSISNDSEVENCNRTTMKKLNENFMPKETVDDTYAESESAGDSLAVVKSEGLVELERLRKQSRKAVQMIKALFKKLQQQDKEIKKLKLDKELVYAQVSDAQLEKYEEVLKRKDDYIKDLENKVGQLQMTVETRQDLDSSCNLQQLLAKRLQGMAYFLDKLLSHKCVIGEEKKKLAESILEQSLALPVGLQLDESNAPADLTMDESQFDMSLRVEDLTLMFGHHVTCRDSNQRSTRKSIKKYSQDDIITESECWSEPDRNVSLARVGLCDTGLGARESTTEDNKIRARRSQGSCSKDNKLSNEAVKLKKLDELTKRNEQLEDEKNDLNNKLDELTKRNEQLEYENNDLKNKLDELTERTEQLEDEKNDLNSKLELAMVQLNNLISENDTLKAALAEERAEKAEALQNLEAMKNTARVLELKIQNVEQQLYEKFQLIEKLQTEKQELESTFMEIEHSLRRAADEASVQASEATLERARAQSDRLRVEKELEETREKLASVMESYAQLQIEASMKMNVEAEATEEVVVHECLLSDEEQPSSSDQGIGSEKLSSPGQNYDVESPRSLHEENNALKQKLAKTQAALAKTLAQLNVTNLGKTNVQRAICREIHKTQDVLRKARDQMEKQSKK